MTSIPHRTVAVPGPGPARARLRRSARGWLIVPILVLACDGSTATENPPETALEEVPDTGAVDTVPPTATPTDSVPTDSMPPDTVPTDTVPTDTVPTDTVPTDSSFTRGLLPYDRSSPVIYVNDDVVDMYTDEYLMALASEGDIKLEAIITQSSVAPYNRWIPEGWVEETHRKRVEGAARARESGFGNIPDPIEGARGHLTAPSSGRIEDTTPLGGPISELIVDEARRATPSRPLVLIMGGPLTAAADAYLMDPDIADRVVVAWLGGNTAHMGDYNGWADAWSAYIALERMHLIVFPVNLGDPRVTKSRIRDELPETPLRAWMLAKEHPTNDLPGDRDIDAPPALVLMEADYVRGVRRVSFDRWLGDDDHRVPVFREDPDSRALLVTDVDRETGTREWWRALKDAH